MATLSFTKVVGGAVQVTAQTLDTTNDFVFKPGSRQVITLTNDTGGSAVVTVVGDEAGTLYCPQLAMSVDASTGYQFTIADGESFSLAPESIKGYLSDSTNTPALNIDVAGVTAVALEL